MAHLGIDIGTTTIKACLLINGHSHTASVEHKASEGLGNGEQDPAKLFAALDECISSLPDVLLRETTKIVTCGQMHGCMLWKSQHGESSFEPPEKSRLYTWQDDRCTNEFLSKLPKPESHLRVASGYACATLFWLAANMPEYLGQFDRAATFQDYVATALCGIDSAIISDQNAASWGYFDCEAFSWNSKTLSENRFPVHLLPKVVPCGTILGTINRNWHGIQNGAVVLAAMGDLQCSVMSAMKNESDAVINISTSAQLCFLTPKGFQPIVPRIENTPIEYFPYYGKRYLAVAASLNGGNVMETFVSMINGWTKELGVNIPENVIWKRIKKLALAEDEVKIEINPTLHGERHVAQHVGASVQHILSEDLSLGKISRSLFRGVITNLRSMMPLSVLQSAGIKRIAASGSALLRNPVLMKELENQYNLPIIYCEDVDAAKGCALAPIILQDFCQ